MFLPILISHCMHHGSSIEEESEHKLSRHPESNNHKTINYMFYSTENSVVLITTGGNKDNKNLMNIKPSCQTFSITFILTSLAKWNTSLGLRQWKNAHAHAHAVPPSERTEWLRMCRTKNVQVYNVCKNTNKPTVIILMHQFKQRLEERMNYQAFNTVERLLKSTTHKQKLACSHSFHWYVNNVYKHNIL